MLGPALQLAGSHRLRHTVVVAADVCAEEPVNTDIILSAGVGGGHMTVIWRPIRERGMTCSRSMGGDEGQTSSGSAGRALCRGGGLCMEVTSPAAVKSPHTLFISRF